MVMVRRESRARYVRVFFRGVCTLSSAAVSCAGRGVTMKKRDGRMGISAAGTAGIGQGIVGV